MARDLIGDIHAQHRKRMVRRVALVVALLIAAASIAIVFNVVADRTARDRVLAEAQAQFTLGARSDVLEAAATLQQGLDDHEEDPQLLAGLALCRTQLFAEFGIDAEGAGAAIESISEVEGLRDAQLARGLMALAQGSYEESSAALAAVAELPPEPSIAPAHETWLAGMLALARPDEASISEALTGLTAVLAEDTSLIAYHRLAVALEMQAGNSEKALADLGRTREQSFTHEGLAADEAIYNAVLRQRLGGVASVSEQLLADREGLCPRDRAHASLARAVVHVQSGELDRGLEALGDAWPELPAWDTMSRGLALELAMEARDVDRAQTWAAQAQLPAKEVEIFEAWGLLNRGDVMKSLAGLAALEQEHPRVAYLQGLALVEQGRWKEAGPWLERADKLIPGRIELDVARARVELRVGDRQAALRKLKGLAEEEPYAPRAWTGLGEAYMHEGERPADPEKAKQAFERALEREHLPAEAMLRLAEIWNSKRDADPEAASKAGELFERAAKTNPFLPRYREQMAGHLAQVGQQARAVELLAAVYQEPGVEAHTPILLCRLSIEQAEERGESTPEALDAWLKVAGELGASEDEIARERARAAVLTGTREDAEKASPILGEKLKASQADVDLRVLYSRSHSRMGDRDRAAAAIRRGLQLTPEADHGALHLEWARIESRAGARRKAAAHARVGWLRMLAADPPPADLVEAAGIAVRMFLRDKKPKPATAIARELTERVPYHPEAWVIRGRAQLAAKRAKEAMESAERALAIDDTNAEAHELYGDTVLRFGYKDKAKAAYEKAATLAETKSDKSDYSDKLARL